MAKLNFSAVPVSLSQDTIFETVTDTDYTQFRKEFQKLGIREKVKFVFVETVRPLTKLGILCILVMLIVPSMFEDDEIPELSTLTFYQIVIQAPIVEELLFRYLLHNFIHLIQICLLKYQIKTSIHSRILCVNTLFALVHLLNFGTNLTLSETCGQVISIFVFPTLSALYEKTDSILVPISSHMFHNFICYVCQQIL